MSRPFGVLVLGVLALAAGSLYLLAGIQLMGIVTFGPVESGNGVWITGLFTFIVGLIYLAVAFALWSLQPWALMFAMIMAVFGLIEAVFALFATGNLAYGLGQAILPGFILWYANREDIQAHFMEGGRR
jgi:cytochrome c oxidase subunit IV